MQHLVVNVILVFDLKARTARSQKVNVLDVCSMINVVMHIDPLLTFYVPLLLYLLSDFILLFPFMLFIVFL